jgi:hypothetical protein
VAYAAAYGARILFWSAYYKDAAPTALLKEKYENHDTPITGH